MLDMNKTIPLLESSLGNNYIRLNTMNENALSNFSNQLLAKIFTVVANKANDIDYDDIEKSGGDFKKYKYKNTLKSSIDTLKEIQKVYDPKAAKNPTLSTLGEMVFKIEEIMDKLEDNSSKIKNLYDDNLIKLLYNNTVMTIGFAITGLLSATLSFESGIEEENYQVLLDNQAISKKHAIFKNLNKYYDFWTKDWDSFYFNYSKAFQKKLNESGGEMMLNEGIVLGTTFWALLATLTPLMIYFVFKIGTIIRESVYLFYNLRMRLAKAMEYQIDLLNANIESLEYRQSLTKEGNDANRKAKVISRQKAILRGLDKIRGLLLVKYENAERITENELNRDNKEFGIDQLRQDQVLI